MTKHDISHSFISSKKKLNNKIELGISGVADYTLTLEPSHELRTGT